MRKGIISPTAIGGLGGVSESLQVVENITQQRGANVEGIFYGSAFQAGVDEFLVLDASKTLRPQSQFLANRTTIISLDQYEASWKMVDAAFSAHLTSWLEQLQEHGI